MKRLNAAGTVFRLWNPWPRTDREMERRASAALPHQQRFATVRMLSRMVQNL
jgi:hypothetical protein